MRRLKIYPLRNITLLLSCIVLLHGAGTLVMAQSSVGVEQMVEQIRQIDSRITALQSELAALELQSDQSGRDSVAIVSASAAQLARIESKMAQVDNLIASKKNEIGQIKAQRQGLGRDSLQKVSAYNSERTVLRDRARQTELVATGIQNELNVLTQRRAQLQQFSQQQSDASQVSIQNEKSRYDSIIVAKQEMLNGMHLQLKQMESDSSAQAASLQSVQLKNEQELQLINSELATVDGRVQSAKAALDQAKARLAEKKGAVSAIVQQIISRKATLASQLTQSSSRIKGYEAELSRLRSNAGAVQKKYEAGRAPIVAKLNEAATTLATREQQQKVWTVIREKFTLDSTITATRNELDELIQKAASGKRGAKKLIDPKEAQLNALLGKLDGYLHEPGVKQMEAQLASMTMSQKRVRIEQVLSNIVNDLSKQTTLKTQAQQALAQYDAQNPLSSDPSLKRMRQLDTLLAAEQAKKTALNSVIDTSDLQIKVFKDSIAVIDAAAYKEIAGIDSEYRNASAQRTEIAKRRDQADRKLKSEYAAGSSSIAAVVKQLGKVRQKAAALQMEIQNTQSRSSAAQNRLLSAQQKFEQGKAVASNEAETIGNTIMEKERVLQGTGTSLQTVKSQLAATESNFQNELTVLNNSILAVEQQIAAKNAELQQMNTQRNSLQFEYDSEIKKQQSALASLRASTSGSALRRKTIQSEITSLQGRRASQLTQIKNRVAGLSGTISKTNQDIERVNNAYNAAIQDSITFESTRDNAFLATKRSIARQDSVLALVTKQIQNAIVEYEKARSDSAAAFSGKISAIAPHVKKIRQLDSLISLKERELSSLKSKRAQAVGDSIAGAQGADAAIVSGAAELRKKQERIASLEVQYAVQEKEKKRIESEAASKGEQFRNSRQIYASKILAQLSRLSDYQSRTTALNAELQAAEAALAVAEGQTAPVVQKTSSKKSTVKNGKDAQMLIERIYSLMGEDRMADAKKLFNSNVKQLKKYASPDAVKMLESSF
ncbi:MAG: hypothetical protein JW915_13180 [Chitinispirillaceae bacterium]|nr:hypothetical protein [Chitinispirillaceae bacterium]